MTWWWWSAPASAAASPGVAWLRPVVRCASWSGVGGGSLHYFNVHVRPPDAVFDDPRWPPGITGEVLAPYFDLARDMLDVAPLTPPAGRVLPRRTEAFREACRATGRAPELVDVAVYTGPPGVNPHGGDPQLPCEYCGNCGVGCHVHAKNTLDLNYLRVAARHGAEIHPLHEVDRIAPQPGGGYRVDFVRRDPAAPTATQPGSVVGRVVIVAAGTLAPTSCCCAAATGTAASRR